AQLRKGGRMVFAVAAAAAAFVAAGAAALMLSRRRRHRPVSILAIVGGRLAEQGISSAEPLFAQALLAPRGETDVWSALAVRLDPVQFRPKLASDVEVKIFRLRWGNDYAMVANP